MVAKDNATQPINALANLAAPHITIAATFKDPQTGALYIHRDLVRVQEPYFEASHIGLMNEVIHFGDVESWVKYVLTYGTLDDKTLLTWNSQGLKAVLDYTERNQWRALHPFRPSLQWAAWMALANGQPRNQKAAVESLEDLAMDIVEPSSVDLMDILRSLRASVNAKADAELRPDGTTNIAFQQDKTVKTGASVDLPATFAITIPVLKGHIDGEGRPVAYRLEVRLRVSVDDQAHLTLRFSMPGAERVLEDVYADRVKMAANLLGEDHALLRAAD